VVVGEIPELTEVLVVGGGPGGNAAALRAAQLGKQVTLVERDAIGGTCLNVGCIPSKALIQVAEAAHLGHRTAGWGVELRATVDWPAVQAHLRSTVQGLTDGVRQLLRAAGVTVVSGTANLVAPDRVAVVEAAAMHHYTFEHVILATGSRPVDLADLPIDHQRVLDATDALFLEQLPASMAIVGGGYIGVELGTAFAKLGVAVTIVELTGGLLPGIDERLGRVVARRLRELGVDVRTGSRAAGLDERGLLVASDGEGPSIVAAERIVVAVGRRPNVEGLGLEHLPDLRPSGPGGLLGVGPDRRLAGRVLAIGDLTPGPALAHKATAEAEVAAHTVAGKAAAFDPAAIPAVVFSDPEVATVGLTTAGAKAQGIDARAFRFPLGASAKARILGDAAGHVEVVADAEGTVIGVHMVGPHVSELAGEAALAIEMAATLEDLTAVIHPHPTMSEAVLEAALGAAGRPLHVHVDRRPQR
jgi:dihydrolipoamide dehydrogenase